jgi:hypothetical protein
MGRETETQLEYRLTFQIVEGTNKGEKVEFELELPPAPGKEDPLYFAWVRDAATAAGRQLLQQGKTRSGDLLPELISCEQL